MTIDKKKATRKFAGYARRAKERAAEAGRLDKAEPRISRTEKITSDLPAETAYYITVEASAAVKDALSGPDTLRGLAIISASAKGGEMRKSIYAERDRELYRLADEYRRDRAAKGLHRRPTWWQVATAVHKKLESRIEGDDEFARFYGIAVKTISNVLSRK